MFLREYLETLNQNKSITFIIAKAVKDEQTPGYHTEYQTTPIRTVWEWLECSTPDNYIMLNINHPPIDITGGWVNWYNKGVLKCCVISTEADLYLHYSPEQAKSMIDMYDRKAREDLK